MPAEGNCERRWCCRAGGAQGAYEAVVWKFLHERDWKPDLICGTPVGAEQGDTGFQPVVINFHGQDARVTILYES